MKIRTLSITKAGTDVFAVFRCRYTARIDLRANRRAVKNYLVLSAIGADRLGLIHELSKVIMEASCHVMECRSAVIASEFSLIMMIRGNWSTLAKLEMQLKRLEQGSAITVHTYRTEWPLEIENHLPYTVEVIALDQPCILHRLTGFFYHHRVRIEELSTRPYKAIHTHTPLFVVNLLISVPATTHIAALRDEFMDFCDEFNFDAMLEPSKS